MEYWKDIPEFEGRYQVSDHGRVRSLIGHRKILSQIKMKSGYLYSKLVSPDGLFYLKRTNRLVLGAFVGRSILQACHNNGNKEDNRLSNLRYDDSFGNMKDAVLSGKMNFGSSHHSSKFNKKDIKNIRHLYSKKFSINVISEMFGVCWGTIEKIVNRKTWKWVSA